MIKRFDSVQDVNPLQNVECIDDVEDSNRGATARKESTKAPENFRARFGAGAQVKNGQKILLGE
jgi:hypothetical protein